MSKTIESVLFDYRKRLLQHPLLDTEPPEKRALIEIERIIKDAMPEVKTDMLHGTDGKKGYEQPEVSYLMGMKNGVVAYGARLQVVLRGGSNE